MGLVALPQETQNDQFTAHKPVHMAIRASLGSSIVSSMGLKHISAPDGNYRQLTYIQRQFLINVHH